MKLTLWRRTRMPFAAAAVLTLALAQPATGSAAAAPGDSGGDVTSAARSISLELDRDFADPSFLKVGRTWYAFASGDGFPYATAPDMRGPWRYRGKSMPSRPRWTKQATRGSYDWAPDVFRRASDGRFLMYYTAHTKGGRPCIGVATSRSPAGPFVDGHGGPRVCPSGGGALDPAPFTKLDGTQWMIYAAVGGTIRASRMNADQVRPAGTRPIDLIRRPGTIIEAPVIQRSGPRLVMFVSRFHYNDRCRYKTEAFVSVGLTAGTWRSAGDVLSQRNSGLCGPGGADVARSGRTTWIMFHAWRCKRSGCDVSRPGPTRRRVMLVGTIGWGKDSLTPRIQ
ncbi:glycoside hydrolase family 43 protein [Thermomonospora umbrina]|uniref:glycoside hydrolase family 43 protein n=1 Tax=Thermomonospora umbrina TaxID=111806 RepID=UPI0014776CCE|nr:glycoside hydrolase family 43 protein [Thermomonospora umbrina]